MTFASVFSVHILLTWEDFSSNAKPVLVNSRGQLLTNSSSCFVSLFVFDVLTDLSHPLIRTGVFPRTRDQMIQNLNIQTSFQTLYCAKSNI